MRHAIATVALAALLPTAQGAQANDRSIYESVEIQQRRETQMGAAEGWAALPHVIVDWVIAPLFGLKPELDRWKIAQEPNLRQVLKETGMPGVLVSVRRETLNFDGSTKTRLIGGEPVIVGPGLNPKSTALAYKGRPSIERSDGSARYDEAASEYLWVQEKDGKLRWSSWPAGELHDEVRLAEADTLLSKTFDRNYDAETAARVIDHLAVNDGDEALRRQAKLLSEARTKALADAKRIDEELQRALKRDQKANAAAGVFQMISIGTSLAGSVRDLAKEFPDKKAEIEQAGATGSKQDVSKVLDGIRADAAAAAGRARQKLSENQALQQEIRRSQQPLLDRRRIPDKVPGIDRFPPAVLKPWNGVQVNGLD